MPGTRRKRLSIEAASPACASGLLRIREVAVLLGSCRATVYGLIKDGSLSYVRLTGRGRDLRVPKDAVTSYITARVCRNGAEDAA
jgi:excisionase family DNA binding protein